MHHWQQALDHWFQAHHGIATNGELLELGLSQRTIGRMVADGRLVTMQPGVFRSAQWPASTLATMRAACARNPLGYVGFTAACSEWGLRRIPDLGVHMLVPHGSSPTLHGVTVHRCRTIDDVDRVDRPDGIRLTSPPRSLFDSADLLGLSAARSVAEQLIHEGMSTIGTIVDTYTRLRHASRPGSRTMLLVLASRPMWCKALHSNLESKVLEEIERQALPAPQRQCPITLADGTVIHADFGWPEWKVGLEVDDPAWHAGSEERHRDAGRDRRAAGQPTGRGNKRAGQPAGAGYGAGVSAADVTPELFDAVVGTEFTLPLADGGVYTVALASCTRVAAAPGAPRAQPFTLLFDAAPGKHLPQGTYTFGHATLGDITIFVVPLGPGPDGRHRYEAVFN